MLCFLSRVAIAMALLLAALTLAFWLRYGGHTVRFPDRSTPPERAAAGVEVVATVDEAPGNIAVWRDERSFINFHPEGRPRIKVAELVRGQPVPWPNLAWQSGRPWFDSVVSIHIDRRGRLWVLDYGLRSSLPPRLLAFDLASRELVHRWDFPFEVAGVGSYMQDFQVAPDGGHVYIADIGAFAKKPALVVYDVSHGNARRLLERDPSVSDKPYRMTVKGQQVRVLGGLYAFHPAIDTICLDAAGEWLYFAPMSHENLFRIRTRDLDNASLSPAELSARVEVYGPKIQSNGASMDTAGNVYLTDVEHGAIAILRPGGRLSTLIAHPLWRWPDGLSFGPADWLYVTDIAIPDITMRSRARNRAGAPYYIYRFRTGVTGTPGH